MDTVAPKDPLQMLSSAGNKTKQLLDLIINSGRDNLKDDPKTIKSIVQWFDGPAQNINKALIDALFPALIESMAGSDAICIKDMTNNYRQSTQLLTRSWQQNIKPELLENPAHAANINWAHDYLQAINLCNEEIIPMADRLLDSQAIENIRLYCTRFNQAPF